VCSSDLLLSRNSLERFGQRIAPGYSFADIVLPPGPMAQLASICDHVNYRHVVYGKWGFGEKYLRGSGLHALFFGPSGTGKTMAAEIVANELSLALYRIDLSLIVSKYIGETEKNLKAVFDEAAVSNAILFFDEADALFGKRTEIKDSHDRYANIEVAYLLQRMEAYEGVTILATNLLNNVDDAFARRMSFYVEFPFPDEKGRLELWGKAFPAGMPADGGVDAGFLAKRFELSVGNIKNVVIKAAFSAAAEGAPVAMRHLIPAVRGEFVKMGKPVMRTDFGEHAVYLDRERGEKPYA
jgi:SpoVK/Ycf46/Vps4 family AAA+-type ATPase